MTAKDPTHRQINISNLITIQVAGFVMFHLNQQILFSVSFQRLIDDVTWIGSFIATFGSWTWLFGPGVISLWWMRGADRNRHLALGFAGASFYCAYEFQYPLITSYIFSLGQMERFSIWMMSNMPTGAQIMGL